MSTAECRDSGRSQNLEIMVEHVMRDRISRQPHRMQDNFLQLGTSVDADEILWVLKAVDGSGSDACESFGRRIDSLSGLSCTPADQIEDSECDFFTT